MLRNLVNWLKHCDKQVNTFKNCISQNELDTKYQQNQVKLKETQNLNQQSSLEQLKVVLSERHKHIAEIRYEPMINLE